ncbi:DUF5683 domain-containing protein [Hymenobacter sp.]|uniref:DUF5683 domain-containing protein n=1 Tax=Hymenobacter sp. TaxID=1898978 RepID=UPI00286A4527|nr:DUF5683 domain-containing protein [Hymenobacter sp.]
MKKIRFLFASLLALTSVLLTSRSQAQVFDPTAPPNPAVVLSDTAEARQVVESPEARRRKAAADSAKRTERMFRAFGYQGIRLTRPGKAALLAALLPGAGQIYNRRWWKLPLVYGSLGGVIYGEVFYQKIYREFADAYNLVQADPTKLQNPIFLGENAAQVRSLNGLNSNVIRFRGYRDIFYLYIGLAYGLQIVDALVDAHLKDFDVSDDLSLHWHPTMLAVPGRALAVPTAPGVLFALRVK